MKNERIVVAAVAAISLAVFFACGGGVEVEDGATNQSPPSASESKPWYSGGTLHKAKMSEWDSAPYADRLATASDFVTKRMQMKGIPIPPVDELRPQAEDLERGISAANESGAADDQDVVTIVAAIFALMDRSG